MSEQGGPDSFRATTHERDLREQWEMLHDRKHDSEGVAVASAFAAQKAAIDAALTAADRAVTKAELAAEKRFDNVNEFRETLADQQRTLMPRNEAELQFTAFSVALKNLEARVDKLTGSSQGTRDTTTLNLSIAFFVIAFLGIALDLVSRFSK